MSLVNILITGVAALAAWIVLAWSLCVILALVGAFLEWLAK